MNKRNVWLAWGMAMGMAAMLATTPAWARGARSAKELRAVDALSTNALPEPSDWEFMGHLPSVPAGTNSDLNITLNAGEWSADRIARGVPFDRNGGFSVTLESSLLRAMVEHGAPWTVTVAQGGATGQPVSLAAYPYALFAHRVAKSRGSFEVAGAGAQAQGAGGSLRVAGRTEATMASATGKLSAGAVVVTNKLEVQGSLKVEGGLAAQSVAGVGTLPVGSVILWYGTPSAVPSGWHICDGSYGTPDLRERFVVGAGNKYALGDRGGLKAVQLTVDQMPSHSHEYSTRATLRGLCWKGSNDGVWQKDRTAQSSAAGGDEEHENRPPFLALYYIKRIE